FAQHPVELVAVGFDSGEQPDGVVVGRGGQLRQHGRDWQLALFRFVRQLERTLAGGTTGGGAGHQARARDSPVRGSTLIAPPGSTKSGTCTMRPVSSVAGLRAPDTRSPWMPGSVSVTVSSTAAGSSTATTRDWYIARTASSPSRR